MRIWKNLGIAVCALAALAIFTTRPAQAQEPHYLRALSELRTARDYIQFDKGRPHGGERHHAVEEINKAIEEIKHAAWDDGKNTQFAPPDHGVTSGWAPIHQAARWMASARGHVAEGVDNPQNTGLRDRIIFHIDDAMRTLNVLEQAGQE